MRRTPLLDLRLFQNPRFTAASGIIMVLFFALFGFLFLSTQYLQFVLGYSPSAAGLRVLPYAAAMIVFAPLSSKLVLRFGTKRVTTTGMLLFSTGLAVAATLTAGTGYGRLAVALVLMGAGMGLAGAPATESIMGSLPPERANIGSAVNDTDPRARRRARRRDRGEHHVVAVLDAAGQRARRRMSRGPSPRPPASRSGPPSRSTRPSRTPLAKRSSTRCHARSLVAALAAALGAFIAWRHLPARGGAQADGSPDADRVGGPLPAGSQQLVAGG